MQKLAVPNMKAITS